MKEKKRFFSLSNIGVRFAAVIGGRGDSWEVSNRVERLDLWKNKWSELPSLQIARECHASCTLDHSAIYVFCGIDNKNQYLNSIEKLPISH